MSIDHSALHFNPLHLNAKVTALLCPLPQAVAECVVDGDGGIAVGADVEFIQRLSCLRLAFSVSRTPEHRVVGQLHCGMIMGVGIIVVTADCDARASAAPEEIVANRSH